MHEINKLHLLVLPSKLLLLLCVDEMAPLSLSNFKANVKAKKISKSLQSKNPENTYKDPASIEKCLLFCQKLDPLLISGCGLTTQAFSGLKSQEMVAALTICLVLNYST